MNKLCAHTSTSHRYEREYFICITNDYDLIPDHDSATRGSDDDDNNMYSSLTLIRADNDGHAAYLMIAMIIRKLWVEARAPHDPSVFTITEKAPKGWADNCIGFPLS